MPMAEGDEKLHLSVESNDPDIDYSETSDKHSLCSPILCHSLSLSRSLSAEKTKGIKGGEERGGAGML